VVIFIILAVMANTMALTVRERLSEYATLKALGFGPGYVARLILGESMLIALAGGVAAILLTPVFTAQLGSMTATLFPTLFVSGTTVAMQAAAALAVGILAALFPMRRAAGVSVVEGLRAVG
jgi:putative ABC transport system permease protein